MILLVHQNAKKIAKVIKGEIALEINSTSCTAALWELAARYPEEIISWCEQDLQAELAIENWEEIFHHDLIMASYAVKTTFLPDSIGYVDQLPFVNVNRKVLYGTWQMSSDVGGIKGKVLIKFQPYFKQIQNFDFLLNSVAKLGQQNSLFCYSAPILLRIQFPDAGLKQIHASASCNQLFSFVHQHYSLIWPFLLFWCLIKYDKKFPAFEFITCFFKKRYFKKEVDLSGIEIKSTKKIIASKSIDVIIPTMGRPRYLHQVLKDFAAQSHLPNKIIIVEQNPDIDSISELDYLKEEEWPFEIIHYYIHQTGVCNARNLALADTDADWVFFSDDDQRFDKDLIETILLEIGNYGIEGLTTSYLQIGERKKFEVPKQWGTFGAGNSVVLKSYTERAGFLPALEHGYGEDKDFGMQLRNAGCDIIYHPGLEIQHLKAPVGGFRQTPELPWEKEDPIIKPSPTLMVYALNHYTPQQLKGYKTSLFLKYYNKQNVKNPVSYIRQMKKSWAKSEIWAEKLLANEKESEKAST